MNHSDRPRLRFAPSPTGHLHIGGARTALFNWLLARRMGGVFVLRIEDTDLERSRREYEDEILRDLAWLGLDWDEGPVVGGAHGPYRQSERLEHYEAATRQLIDTGHAYRCTCTTERLDEVRNLAMKEGRKAAYDGHCRELALGPDCGPHVVRFRTPSSGENVIEDLVKGRVVIQNEELDDFVIRRTDGAFTYNFVVVIDDAGMGITHVLRGDDHLANTPKQINIYRALGAPVPAFGHMPLILGPDGQRLSKRHGATSVGAYRELGYLPEALVNYLARLGWSHGDMELFSVRELQSVFDVSEIGKAAGRWDANKLIWVNQHWIQTVPEDTLLAETRAHLEARGAHPSDDLLAKAILTMRSRARTLVELAEMVHFYFVEDEALVFDPEAAAKFLTPASAILLEEIADLLQALERWDPHAVEQAISTWLTEKGMKLGAIAQPLRVCITGRRVGPGLHETLDALGREHSLNRIRRGAAIGRGSIVAGETPI